MKRSKTMDQFPPALAGDSSESPSLILDGQLPPAAHRSSPKFRREDPHELRYSVSVATAIAISWAARLLPRPIRYVLADAAGEALYRVTPTYRRNVLDNVSHVVDRPPSSALVKDFARSVFRLSSRNFADLLVVPHVSVAEFERNVKLIEGSWQELDRAFTKGKGIIFVSAHLGSFDYAGQLLNAKGYKLHIVTGRTTARFIFDGVTYLRGCKGMVMLEPSPSGVRRVIQAIRRGECAAFVGDRDFFQNGKPVTFFGEETTLPPGAVRIARDTGATIVPMFGIVIESGPAIRLLPGFTIEKTNDPDRDIAEGLDRVAAVLEAAIAEHPDQWVMFQRVWPSEPVDPVRVFPVGSPLETDIVERIEASLPRRRRHPPASR